MRWALTSSSKKIPYVSSYFLAPTHSKKAAFLLPNGSCLTPSYLWKYFERQKWKKKNEKECAEEEESEKYAENFSPFDSFGHTGIWCLSSNRCVNIILSKFMSFIFLFEIIFKRQTHGAHTEMVSLSWWHQATSKIRARHPCAMLNVCWPAFEFLKSFAFE